MPTFAILSQDPKMRRYLSLLCEEAGMKAAQEGEATLHIVDVDTVAVPQYERMIFTGSHSPSDDVAFLAFPFDEEVFLALCQSVLTAPVSLTPTEAKLLQYLKNANGQIVENEVLLKEVFGPTADKGILPLYIHYLRQKLEKDGKKRIFSKKGKGYAYKC